MGVALGGLCLRLAPAFANRLHPDEALYGYWGLRILYGHDPWLLTTPVYKPPLLPYLLAATQWLFGSHELAIRFPNLAAGLLMIPLAGALAGALYGHWRTTLAAALALTLSPFAILFAPTAFPDPLMVMLGLAACVAAARGRSGWAGALAGLAFTAKQTGLAWLPLVAGLALASSARTGRSGLARRLGMVGLGWALGAGFAVGWDVARVAQGAASFWSAGIGGYGGLRLIWPQELWGRLAGWVQLAGLLLGSSVANVGAVIGALGLTWRALRGLPSRAQLADVLLVSFCALYVAVHWLWAFPVWDRYLLPLAPLLAALLGRVVSGVVAWLQRWFARLRLASGHSARFTEAAVTLTLVLVCLLGPAARAAANGYPIGGDHGAYDGIDQVTAFLRAQPPGTVVYQHWLGWQYGFYLSGAPIYAAYWPTPAWLAQDVRAFGAREPRYIAFPAWEQPARVEHALAGVGYGLREVLRVPNRAGGLAFTLYRIEPRERR